VKDVKTLVKHSAKSVLKKPDAADGTATTTTVVVSKKKTMATKKKTVTTKQTTKKSVKSRGESLDA
jgi:hypothetical protein